MKMTKQDKQILREQYEIVFRGNEKMIDFCVRSASGFVDFGDLIVEFEKPTILTSFWFGEHNYEDKSGVCEAASKSIDFFMRENIDRMYSKHLLDRIDGSGEYYSAFRYPYVVKEYVSRYEGCRLGRIEFADSNGEFCNCYFNGRARKLDDDEVEELREALCDEVAKFEKRLRTYLKRYGLSKCSYNTYWADR